MSLDNINYFIVGPALIFIVLLVKTIKTWPSRPEGFSVHRHNLFELWIPPKVRLYVPTNQQDGRWIGLGIRKMLKGKGALSASVLDWLLAHPKFIPDEWKGKSVYFWGTIYRRKVDNGKVYVRYLCWQDGRWESDIEWLGEGSLPGYSPDGYRFRDSDPAAVLVHWWRK